MDEIVRFEGLLYLWLNMMVAALPYKSLPFLYVVMMPRTTYCKSISMYVSDTRGDTDTGTRAGKESERLNQKVPTRKVIVPSSE